MHSIDRSAIDEMMKKINPIVLSGFGEGLTWGAAIVQWGR
jgi:3-oxoacyl-[acyl-carrier-protein] synthase III